MAKRPISRRTFLLNSSGTAGLVLAGGSLPAMPTVGAETQTGSGQRSQTPAVPIRVIPSCAWKRTLGDLPKIALMPEEGVPAQDRAGLNTLARVKKGIPLGGIGAGNFMYNICGTFGPWQMKVGRYEERFLPQGAFHIREQVKGKPATARTLATDDMLPAWTRLQSGEAEYYALFPRGWCTYRPFETNIALEFFTPVIKDNYRETSLPATLFQFRIHNPLSSPVEVSVMFTFPNAPYTGPQNTPMGKTNGAEDSGTTARDRKGLTNELARDQHLGVTAILMKAHHSTNPPETENSEWCIATNAAASHTTNWDGEGDGAQIWRDFVDDGELADKPLSLGSELPSGALCVKTKVAPDGEVIVPFALSWYFPQIEFGHGTRWWRRYTEYYPTKSGQAFEIVKEALLKRAEWLEAIETWQAPIVENPAYPGWLKQSVLNELYYATFGGSFWENGCITKPKKFGNRPGQHLASVMECQEYAFAETFDVRHHASRSNTDLWPQIERDILLAFSDFIRDSPDGSCPHDAGSISEDPFFDYDGYGRWYNTSPMGIKGRITTPWSEFSPKFIQQCHAYWHKTKDSKFLDDVWPALLRTYRYQRTTDTDGDGLSEMKSSEYKENKLFNAILWLGALEALEAIAEHKLDKALAEEFTIQRKKAQASTEEQFWNEELGYYQYNAHNSDIMADATVGQRYVDVTGLPPVVNAERLTSHYRQLFRRAVLPLRDFNGDGVGDMGAANALHPDSTPGVGDSEYAHQFEVWTGVSYCAAANLYHWGKRIQDGSLQADALLVGWGLYYQTWVNEQTAYWFSTPEAWRLEDPKKFRALMYQRARGIWELAMEVSDPYCS